MSQASQNSASGAPKTLVLMQAVSERGAGGEATRARRLLGGPCNTPPQKYITHEAPKCS